ncbi:MAG: SBBP repeat-containing protein, partial [Caldimonas sp.]
MKLVEMQGANPGAKRRRMAGVAAGVLALAGVFAAVTWLRSEPLVQAGPVAPVQAAPSRASALVTASPRRIGDHRAAARFLQFEPNRGQAPQAVRYLSRGPAHRVEIFDDGIALSAATPRGAGEGGADASAADASARLRFVGARSAVGFEAREPGPGQANYLVGDDASKWIRSVPGYRQLRRPELYPGIDLVYYSREGALEFDLVVKAGADPSRIRMHVGGARPPAIEASGDLLLDGAGGSLRLHRPVLYQNIAGEKKMLDARYVLRGERTLGFALPAYDKRYPLVIDPVFKLLYSTYLTGFHDDQVGALVLDAQSNAYVVGRTNSDDFVISGNAVQKGKSTTGLQYNIVLTKFDA